MAKLSGWQKLGLFAGVGCVSVLGVLVLGVVVAVVWARSTVADLGDTTPARVERAIALPPSTAAAAAPAGAGDTRGASAAQRLTVDLEEGDFTIEPGPAGGRVQIDGTFAPALYELTEDVETSETGGPPRTTIRLRSKAPVWARMFAGISDQSRPRLTVRIPQDVPLDLSLRVSMGESRVNLGGLTLSTLDLDFSMGEHRIDFSEPLEGGVQRVNLNASMGEIRVANLGNTRAQAIDATGNMGSLVADLGGAWQAGDAASISFTQSMGELTLRVPNAVRLERSFTTSMAEVEERPAPSNETQDPNAPVLRLRVTTSMGGSSVARY